LTNLVFRFMLNKLNNYFTMKTIILGTAHLKSTPGKCSPDKRLKEYAYSREIVAAVKAIL